MDRITQQMIDLKERHFTIIQIDSCGDIVIQQGQNQRTIHSINQNQKLTHLDKEVAILKLELQQVKQSINTLQCQQQRQVQEQNLKNYVQQQANLVRTMMSQKINNVQQKNTNFVNSIMKKFETQVQSLHLQLNKLSQRFSQNVQEKSYKQLRQSIQEQKLQELNSSNNTNYKIMDNIISKMNQITQSLHYRITQAIYIKKFRILNLKRYIQVGVELQKNIDQTKELNELNRIKLALLWQRENQLDNEYSQNPYKLYLNKGEQVQITVHLDKSIIQLHLIHSKQEWQFQIPNYFKEYQLNIYLLLVNTQDCIQMLD